MKLYSAGDSATGLCEACKAICPSTFAYRDVPFSDGIGIVKGILVQVCDQCGGMIAVPPQSTPAIRRAWDQRQVPLEVAVPASDIEIV